MRVVALIALICAAPALAQETAERPDPEAGRSVYTVFCQSCHGAEGRGDGAFRDVLSVPPADLTGIAARNGGTFPTFDVMRQIDGRDRVEGHGVIMPIFGPLFDGEVAFRKTGTGQPIVTSRSIADLTGWIESIQEGE